MTPAPAVKATSELSALASVSACCMPSTEIVCTSSVSAICKDGAVNAFCAPACSDTTDADTACVWQTIAAAMTSANICFFSSFL